MAWIEPVRPIDSAAHAGRNPPSIKEEKNMIFKRLAILPGCLLIAFQAFAATTPFADNNGQIPPSSQYQGPLFKLSHQYPAQAPVPAMPWRAAINNGVITTQNAAAYTQALKEAVSKDMRVLIEDYANWDAAKRGWYNEPWLGGIREAIHGMYVGNSELDASLFKDSGLTKPITTYVLTYYDKTAAQTLYKVWNKTAMKPAITPSSTQFPEGSLIVKAAFITADPAVWPVMTGSQAWPLYITTDATTGNFKTPQVVNTYFMQFDIIVKDSQSAPKTGWVFSTLVYDRNAPGKTVWDKMVPLGAQWGNDPQANSTKDPSAPLVENWNNPAAPPYGSETLGWGGRLSGPNDGAMNDIAYTEKGKQYLVKNAQNSSCMSCHSTAQWDVNNPSLGMKSFLLPTTSNPPKTTGPGNQYLVSPPPGSPDWLRWFQDRKGNVPMNAGSVAADFDMVLTFKSLPIWYSAVSGKQHQLTKVDRTGKQLETMYNGKVLQKQMEK